MFSESYKKLLCVFRVDASEKIGTGHIMRCLTLAFYLQECGYQCMFICRELGFPLKELFAETPFDLHILPKPIHANEKTYEYEDWLQVPVAQDAFDTIQILENIQQDCTWLIVDHYAVNKQWESVLKSKTQHILVIDDLANREHLCDILLDQNFYQNSNRYLNKVHKNCKLLLGLDYVLLRKSLRYLIPKVEVRKKLQSVLVNFGGIDATNETLKALKGLMSLNTHKLNIHVVIGAKCPHRASIESICAVHHFNFYCQTNELEKIVLYSDLAIGAGGTTLWERIALGLPSIVSCIAENQREILEDLRKVGCIAYLGLASETTPESYTKMVKYFLENVHQLQALSKSCINRIDGEGCNRVLQTMKVIVDHAECRIAPCNNTRYS